MCNSFAHSVTYFGYHFEVSWRVSLLRKPFFWILNLVRVCYLRIWESSGALRDGFTLVLKMVDCMIQLRLIHRIRLRCGGHIPCGNTAGLRPLLSSASLQMCYPVALIVHSACSFVHYPCFAWGANGGSGGKAPQGPVPPGTRQRK